MFEEIITATLSQGRIEFAVLIAVIVYVLKVNNDRENKYLATIDTLSKSVNKIEKVEGEVMELGKKVDKINDNLIDRFRR